HNDTSFTATQGCTQANISLIPEDLTFCIRRFLSDKDQRPPPVRGEAEAEGNMSVLLHALDAKIGNSPVGHN
ncbi:hypothetical protein M441DRAFT_142051, partial [Trichoderma asperellum CBS 433.97]